MSKLINGIYVTGGSADEVPGSAILQTKIADASVSQISITPDASYDGLTSVIINAVNSSIDNNIKPSNIKKNVSILGCVGTLDAPDGSININANGTYDVTNYASVSVNVQPQTETITITQNGIYSPTSPAVGFSEVTVNTAVRNEFGNTGHIDRVGLAALGWNTNDMDWLQSVCWWDEENDAEWAVTQANITKGASLDWTNWQTYKTDSDIRFFPKLTNPTSTYCWNNKFKDFAYLYAIPTDGWNITRDVWNNSMQEQFSGCYNLYSIGNFIENIDFSTDTWHFMNFFYNCYNIRKIGNFPANALIQTLSAIVQQTNIRKILGLHNVNASSLSNLQYMCKNAYGLEEFDMPPVPSGVTISADMFANCFRLQSIIHSGTISQSISFSYCSSLSRASVLVLFNALDSTVSGQTITLHTNVKAFLSDADKAIATDKGWTIA